jgi:hypothetical protein
VTSKDGSVFEVKAGENSSFKIARSEVEWLYFAAFPATTAALSPNRLMWNPGCPTQRRRTWPSTTEPFEVRGVSIYRAANPECAKNRGDFRDSRRGGRVSAPVVAASKHDANSYSGGTVNVQFGTKTISRTTVVNGLNTERISLPADLPKESVVNYRIFHDRRTRGFSSFAMANDSVRGLRMAMRRAQMFGGGSRAQPINYILFERQNSSQNATLKFNSVRVQPWNGLVPDDGAASQSEDLLSFAIGASLRENCNPSRRRRFDQRSNVPARCRHLPRAATDKGRIGRRRGAAELRRQRRSGGS